MKKIMYLLVFVLMFANVNAQTISNNPNDYIILDFFNRSDSSTIGDDLTNNTWIKGGTVTDGNIHKDELRNKAAFTGTNDNEIYMDLTGENFADVVTFFGTFRDDSFSGFFGFGLQYSANNRCQIRPEAPNMIYLGGSGNTNMGVTFEDNRTYNFTISFNVTSDKCRYMFNGTVGDTGWVDDSESRFDSQIRLGGGGTGLFIVYDNIRFFNGTEFPEEVSQENDSDILLTTMKIDQTTNITVNTIAYTTIQSGVFEVTSDKEGYFGATLQIMPSASNTAICRVTVNGEDRDSEATRSLISGEIGIMNVMGNQTTLTAGNYTIDLDCKRSGGGSYIVSNSNIIGIQNNEYLNSTYSKTTTAALTPTYQIVDTITHTTSNNATKNGSQRLLLTDWTAQYDYTSTNNLTTLIEVNGEYCGEYNRYGTISTSGSVGSACITDNLSNATTYQINISAKGTGTITYRTHIIDIIINNKSYNSTSLNNTVVNTTTLQTIKRIPIENIDIVGANAYLKIGIPVQSKSGTADFTIKAWLEGHTYESLEYKRTIGDGEPGVIIITDIIKSIGLGEYNLTINASCSNSNCEITGDTISIVLTDGKTINPNNFIINASNNVTGVSVGAFIANIDDIIFTTATGQLSIPKTGENISVVLTATNFFSNDPLIHNATDTLTVNLTPYTIINATDLAGVIINNFTVNYTQIGNVSNTNTVSTTNGEAKIGITNGTFNINIFDVREGSDLFAKSSVNLTASDFITSYTFTLFETNSINISIFYELDRSLVTDRNVTLQFISSLEAVNRTTDNGSLFISLLQPSIIDIRYSSSGYRERSYFYSLKNQSTTNLSLYMLDSTNGTLIIITNVDETGSPIEGVTVQLLRGFIINSVEQFEVVEMDITDFAGEGVVTAMQNDVRYIIKTVDNVNNNKLLFLSNPFEITGTTLRITLDLLADPLASFNSWREITFTGPVFNANNNNITGNWSASYVDIPGLINPGGIACLVVSESIGIEKKEFGSSCSSATSANLRVEYSGTRGTYAKLVVDTNTENSIYLLKAAQNLFNARTRLSAALGGAGAFWSAVIIYSVSTMLIFNPATMVYGIIAGLLSVWFLGFASGTFIGFISLIILGGIIAFKLRT